MGLTRVSGDILQTPLNVGVVTASQVNVGSAVTIQSGGFQIGSSDLHSTGLTVQNLNSTGVITATSFVGDGSALTGIDATALKDSGGNVKVQANTSGAVVTGVVTATSFSGDGSALTGIDATALKDSGGNVKVQANTSGAVVTGVLTATSFVGDGSALTGIGATQIQTGNTSVQTVDTGSDGHVKITTEGNERLRIDNAGRIATGNAGFSTASLTASTTQYANLHLIGGAGTNNGASIFISRNTPSTNAANQDLGNIYWGTNDGAPFARIGSWADGTPTGSSYPGYLSFQTTLSGATAPSERWRINNYGLLHNGNGQHAHGSANFAGDYKCQMGIFGSAESGTNGSSAVGSGPFDTTYKNSEWDNKTLTYGTVNELIAEYNLSQASRCNIGAHFYVTNAGGGDYSFPTGGSGTSYWTPNGSSIWATAAGGGGYVGYAAIRADVQSYYASGAAFYARVKNGVTSGVGYGYHCDLGGHPYGGRQVGVYVRQMDNQTMTGNAGYVYKRHNTSSTFWVMQVENGAGSTIGGITCTNTNTAFPTSSDYRLKENVVPLTGAVERLKQIPVHRFNFIASPEVTQDGFLAHELQPIVPIAVSGTKDEVKTLPKKDENDNFVYEEGEDGEKIPVMEEVPEYQTVDYSKVVPLLTAALQEALQKIDDLQARLDAAGL